MKDDQHDIESIGTATETLPTASPEPSLKLTSHYILQYLWSVYL